MKKLLTTICPHRANGRDEIHSKEYVKKNDSFLIAITDRSERSRAAANLLQILSHDLFL